MLVGQEINFKYLSNSIINKDFVHAYLFVGPEHIGKTFLAKKFAQTLLCEEGLGEPCLKCKSCKSIETDNQPDLFLNDNDLPINVEEIRELTHFLELKPYQSRAKILVIAHAERMSVSATNAFLKTLEEPVQNTIIILTTENLDNILPTIVSRARIIRFGFEKEGNIKKHLISSMNLAEDKATEITEISCGRIGLAISLANNQDGANSIKTFLNSFVETTKSESIVQKLKLAEELGDEKKTIIDKIDYLEGFFHQRINSGMSNKELLILTKILDKIAQSRIFIKNNVNRRLVLESILLTGVKG